MEVKEALAMAVLVVAMVDLLAPEQEVVAAAQQMMELAIKLILFLYFYLYYWPYFTNNFMIGMILL